jgi:DedD protein
MEEKNELSDILLEQKGPNTMVKIKRLAVIAILLILLFVLVLMIMKLISRGEDTSGTLTDSLLSQTSPQDTADNTTNLYDIPLDNEVEANNTTTADTTTVIVEDDAINVSPPDIAPPVTVVTPPKATSVPKQTTVTPPKTTTSAGTAASSVPSGHYIQVGAFSNVPNKGFLNNITRGGYQYQLYKTTSASQQMVKVLVGPFKSEAATRMELPSVKSSIAKDAMYYKVP